MARRLTPGTFSKGWVTELAALAPGRHVSVEVHADLPVPSSRISALGMVVAELVTNSLKYGAGAVKVELARAADDLAVTVSDEGKGFPAEFPASQGSGLGARLIRTYSGHGREAIRIDRDVAFGRITVRFRPA